jgi:hypothetical protein
VLLREHTDLLQYATVLTYITVPTAEISRILYVQYWLEPSLISANESQVIHMLQYCCESCSLCICCSITVSHMYMLQYCCESCSLCICYSITVSHMYMLQYCCESCSLCICCSTTLSHMYMVQYCCESCSLCICCNTTVSHM